MVENRFLKDPMSSREWKTQYTFCLYRQLGKKNIDRLTLAYGQDSVYLSSYRRPNVNLNFHRMDNRVGFDFGLTSSYSRAG